MTTGQEQVATQPRERGLAADLLRFLERHTGVRGLAYAMPPAPLSGGFWAALYRFRLAHAPLNLSGDLVLRVMPTDDEHCQREARMQAAAAAAGFPAPQVYLTGGRDEGLGRPFMIMARAPGGSLSGGLEWSEKAQALLRMPDLLAETMARLHALDPAVVEGTAVGVETVLAELAERIRPLARDGYTAAMAWLFDHQPVERRRAVCHGDLHPFNLLIAKGRASAVLDWTNAVLADPAFDVAYTAQLFALWPLAVPIVPRALLKPLAGRAAAWRFLREYRRQAKVEISPLPWYQALHCLRVLVRVGRWRTGITRSRHAHNHPWELAAVDAANAFHRHAGIRVELPAPLAHTATA